MKLSTYIGYSNRYKRMYPRRRLLLWSISNHTMKTYNYISDSFVTFATLFGWKSVCYFFIEMFAISWQLFNVKVTYQYLLKYCIVYFCRFHIPKELIFLLLFCTSFYFSSLACLSETINLIWWWLQNGGQQKILHRGFPEATIKMCSEN